jgi:hypothetical protein
MSAEQLTPLETNDLIDSFYPDRGLIFWVYKRALEVRETEAIKEVDALIIDCKEGISLNGSGSWLTLAVCLRLPAPLARFFPANNRPDPSDRAH